MSKKKLDKNNNNIISQSVEKLKEKIILLKKELFNLRFQKTMGELKNTSRFKEVRKDVARIKTELNTRLNAGDK